MLRIHECSGAGNSGRGIAASLLALGLLMGGGACGGGEAPQPETEAARPASERPAPGPAAIPARSPSEAAAKAAASSPLMDEIRKISDIPNRIEDPDRAVAELKSWLTHDEREIREAAILALWDLESGSANQALADVARQEPDPELKGYAVEELVDREAPEAVEALLAVLDDEDADLREQAAEGLEELEDKGAIPALYKRLEVEQDEWVRDAILSALDTMDPDFDEEKYEE